MSSSASAPAVPALQNGDRLTRRDFERRYAAMPHVHKAELIEGVVYMPSPVHANAHGRPHAHLMTWLGVYAAATPHVHVADNTTVRLDLDNEPQPDGLLRIDARCGGQSHISDDDFIEGPPELIVEVAHSSAAYDLHDKKHAYRRNGVQEYVVWQIEEARVDGFALDDGAYRPMAPPPDGHLASAVFPGLVLNVEALLAGDLQAVLATVQDSIDSEAHRAFVDRLQSRA
ncbi:MAG: Uma2 family endonuclease [Bacteroidetes bacterium]|jgi:Uma2 family endonuclease|nr:Uma2 family endonuclease [Bacteroidota bacterium]